MTVINFIIKCGVIFFILFMFFKFYQELKKRFKPGDKTNG